MPSTQSATLCAFSAPAPAGLAYRMSSDALNESELDAARADESRLLQSAARGDREASIGPTVATSRGIAAFRPLPWLGWAAAAILAVACTYFALSRGLQDHEKQLWRESEALTRLEAASLRQQVEAESILAQQQTKALRGAYDELAGLRRTLDLAALKIVRLASPPGHSSEAEAIIVWDAEKQEGLLVASHLPAIAENQDYQLWLVDPQDSTPVDGGVFRVDTASGQARVTFRPGKPAVTVAKFAVSVERKGGVPKAESPMVLLSQ